VINHGTIVGDVVLGDGADIFVFGKGGTLAGNLFLGGGHNFIRIENGSGTSQIADFGAGDVIDVSTFFSSFGDLEAHSQQSGNDVVITLDHNDHLVLAGVQLSALNAGDFLFDQLVQAMAGFGGASGATDGLSTIPLGAETSQQPLLTTPQHA